MEVNTSRKNDFFPLIFRLFSRNFWYFGGNWPNIRQNIRYSVVYYVVYRYKYMTLYSKLKSQYMLTDYGKQNQSTNPCPSFRGTYTSRTIAKIRMAVTNCRIVYSSTGRIIIKHCSTSVCFSIWKYFIKIISNLINFCTFTSYCPNMSLGTPMPGICNNRYDMYKM